MTSAGVEVARLETERNLSVQGAQPTMKPKNTICLWVDKDALDAARFYAATFPIVK